MFVDSESGSSRQVSAFRMWTTSNSEVGRGVLQQQHEKRYEALAKRSSEDHRIAAALQDEINRLDASKCGIPPRARPAIVELPRSDEINAACKVLRETLRKFGLRERSIVGDGNCQFRAVADQLFGSEDEHATIRERAVSQMRANPTLYSGFIASETLEQYLDRMGSPCSWGDNLTLQAIADTFDVVINLITDFPEKNAIVLRNNGCQQPAGVIWLGFYAEFHYVSIEHLD